MNKSQTAAYKILSNEEKTALDLSLVQSRSTWEAGEIMGKAHYKYLEISQRAVKFFKLFTEYFNLYERLIPLNCDMAPAFRQYIICLIDKRMELKATIKTIHQEAWQTPKGREEGIRQSMVKLKQSKFTEDNHLYHLLMDFDRWNNFRILPVNLQEPSAFKRRNKHKLRKLVNLFTSLHPLAIKKIKQLYSIKGGRGLPIKNPLFLPLHTIHDESLSQVIMISNNKDVIRVINNLTLYTFQKKEEAERFLEIIIKYINKDYKHCKDGQVFWPEFRVLSKRASNYDTINNITPSRKFILDNASRDFDDKLFLSMKLTNENKAIIKSQSKVK